MLGQHAKVSVDPVNTAVRERQLRCWFPTRMLTAKRMMLEMLGKDDFEAEKDCKTSAKILEKASLG